MFRSTALIFSSAVPQQCGVLPSASTLPSTPYHHSLSSNTSSSSISSSSESPFLLSTLFPNHLPRHSSPGTSPTMMITTTPSTSNGAAASAATPASASVVKGERCVGCGSESSIRVHYGASSCHGCKAFFRRSVFEGRVYLCSAENNCDITNESRNRCRACRLRNCLEGGMNPKHVREERSKIEKMPPSGAGGIGASTSMDAASANSDQEVRVKTPVDECPLTQFICSLERQTELLTDDDVTGNDELCEWSRDISLTFGLQNPRLVIKRSKTNWQCDRVMTSADLYSAWYRAFVLHADWAMGVPDFRVMPLADQTHLFKQNFISFGWITYAYKCYELNNDDLGIPLGNGAYIPYEEGELATMDQRWASTYGLVGKKLIELIVKPMREMETTHEEYCLLKSIALFQMDCPLSDMARNTCIRMRDRLLEALAIHIDHRFPHLTPNQKTTRAMRLTLLLPSFNHIGQIEAAMIQNLTAADLTELSGVPMEILNQHRPGRVE